MCRSICLFLLLNVLSQTTGSGDGFDRIYGGDSAKIENFPYMVSVLFTKYYFIGQGALISEKHALVSAEVVYSYGRLKGHIYIQYGHDKRMVASSLVECQDIKISEDFELKSLKDSIAIVFLANPVPLSDIARPVALPSDQTNFDAGIECVVSGWGSPRFNEMSLMELRYAVIPVVSREECEKSYDNLGEDHFCAGGNGKGGCYGDFGSPLVCNGTIAGLWIRSDRCDSKPGVYASVKSQLNWIVNSTNI